MRHVLGILVLAGFMITAATPALADERADWGVAVSVAGGDEPTLLVLNDGGFRLIVVDMAAEIHGAGLGPMTFTDIQPGDRVDYAVSTWAGMDIADTLHLTPRRQARAGL
ncbi:MAG: hypothetical protein ACREM3_07560 [Candidatus Rokuibacteriota bacterium]